MGSIEGAKVVYDDSNSVFPINIVRTNRRKTISISVAEGYVRVLVPKRLSEKEVSQIIDKKLPWIRDKIRAQSQIVPVKPREYVTGSNFMYLGKNYKLKLIPNTIAVIGKYYIDQVKMLDNSINVIVAPAFRYNYLWDINKKFNIVGHMTLSDGTLIRQQKGE